MTPLRPFGRPRRTLLRLASTCAVALPLLVGCGGSDEPELWVIGLDGADWDILAPLMASGDMPNLARLRREGAWGPLMSDEPMLSPILWTSIATGKTADLHGVTWFMSDAPDGTKIPVSSRNRWVRAVWNIASENGIKVGVLGWWATWPAEPVNGFVVSDYVAYHSFGVTGSELQVPGKTYPPQLIEDVERLFPHPTQVPDALLTRMVRVPPSQLSFDANAPYGGPLPHLRQSIATTLGFTALAKQILEEDRPRFFTVYYEGTDATEHLFTEYAAPKLPWVSDEDFAKYGNTVSAYWKWQDEQLGELLALRRPNTLVMIVSDHGFRTGAERLKEEEFSIDTADQSHLPDGIVLLHGSGIQSGARIERARIYDVTPTALYALGLPVADDFSGRVLEEAFTPKYRTDHPATTVPTYETGDWDRGDDIVVDPEAGQRMEDQLRSLGYITSDGESDPDGAIGASGNVEQAVNLAVVLRKQGRYEEAAERLREVLRTHPKNIEARANLAQTFGEMGRLAESAILYRGLVEDDPDDLRHRENLALSLAKQNKPQEALAVFEDGLEAHPDWAGGMAGVGFALHKLGRDEDALPYLTKALQTDPRLAVAYYYRGVVRYENGQRKEAREDLEQALRLDPFHGPAAAQLAAVLADTGDTEAARALLESAGGETPSDPSSAAQLGVMALQGGQAAEAIPLLEIAVAGFPDDPELRGNLGFAYAMTGNLPKAVESFERVLEIDPGLDDARAQLGSLYAQMGKMDDAQRLLREAIANQPQNPDFRMALGVIYQQTGRLPEAEREYLEAIRIAPQIAPYHLQLAMLYRQQGRQDMAQRSYDRAVQLDPSLAGAGPGGQR